MSSTPIKDAVTGLIKGSPARFFMPGHKGEGDLHPLSAVLPLDITELPGADDLYLPKGAIGGAQRICAAVLGAEGAFFLTGGATQGIHAALLLARRRGGTVLADRNCHRAVVTGAVLAGLELCYIRGETLPHFGISGPISPKEVERGLAKSGASAVIITSPTYYGVISDIEEIGRVCRAFGASLIVDGAHGAHLGFGSLPEPPQRLGAHYTVASAHKTLSALTQGAFLLTNDGAGEEEILIALSASGTSSPSYLIMISLEESVRRLKEDGDREWQKTASLCRHLNEEIDSKTPFATLGEKFCQSHGAKMDVTRLVVSTAGTDIDGYELYRALFEKGVMLEMADRLNVVAIITPQNGGRDAERLLSALVSIGQGVKKTGLIPTFESPPLPRRVMSLREAFFAPSRRVNIKSARGLISAEAAGPYPPGVPVIMPGEIIEGGAYLALSADPQRQISVIAGEYE